MQQQAAGDGHVDTAPAKLIPTPRADAKKTTPRGTCMFLSLAGIWKWTLWSTFSRLHTNLNVQIMLLVCESCYWCANQRFGADL